MPPTILINAGLAIKQLDWLLNRWAENKTEHKGHDSNRA